MQTKRMLETQQTELEDAFRMEVSAEDIYSNRDAAKLYNFIRKRGKRIVRLCKRISTIS